MTTVTVPAEPRTVPALVVDPEAIRGCGADLRAASAQIDDLGTFVAGGARIGDWTGLGATSYHDAIGPTGRRADAMSLALRAVARRVDAHADEMARLRTGRDDLVDARTDLIRAIATLRAEIAAATEADAVRLQLESDGLARRVTAFEQDLTTWVDAVGAEETAMAEAFDRVLTLEQVERAYGGVADPADGALATKPPAGATPEAVNDWWDGLTREQQLAVVVAAPGAIGNLPGIPARDRHAANTVALDRDLADWGSLHPDLLTDDERRWLDNARAADEARREIASRADPATGEPITAQVYLYDPAAFDGDGRIAVSAGDLGTADNVAVVVPGLGTDATSAPYHADRAATLYEAARTLDHHQTNATLFWIGYDAPDNLPWEDGWDAAGVVREDLAEAGGARLADTVDGLRASRDGEPAHLTAIGHSYGSTTVGHGAHDEGLAVDDIVVVGSPGLGGDTEHASELGIDPGHVWAGANSNDPVADLGNHGAFHLEVLGGLGLGDDPVEDDFGAHRFQAESTSRGGPNPFLDHSKYFDHDTESLANITRIVNGDYDAVRHADHVYDPWLGGPEDPEAQRRPTAPNTFDG
ncbi:MAG TPA: alpha/beta hydrolase [Nocardioides sp.]|nr:alpha/beta hydrolase [Nocardioides sp.]